MTKRLFEVEAKWYVMAESEMEAQAIPFHLGECSVEAFEAKAVDSEWWDAIPFGGDDDRTCGQIISGPG